MNIRYPIYEGVYRILTNHEAGNQTERKNHPSQRGRLQHPHDIQQPCREELQRQGVFGLYRFRSHSRHGIYLREDRILFGREFSRNGRNQAITFPLVFHRRKSGTGSDPPGLLFLPPVATPTTPTFRTDFFFFQ